jgi:IS30 family transposase
MERSTVLLLHKRGKTLREIASELGRSKTTIARALSEAVYRQPSTRRRKSQVDVFHEQIIEWLQQGLSAVRMMELAREDPEHPYSGVRTPSTVPFGRLPTVALQSAIGRTLTLPDHPKI